LYDASQHSTGGGARARSLPAWPGARPLRSWQQQATEAVRAHSGTSFLASATPAAGKTTFGLHIAHRMLSAGFVSRVVVAGPTTHICRQWAADAARYGIDLEPNRPNSDGPESTDFHGVARQLRRSFTSHMSTETRVPGVSEVSIALNALSPASMSSALSNC
jgi:type III restriction/modification enzyme restriction subunit